MKAFFKEIEDTVGYIIGLIAAYLAPIFAAIKANIPINWFGVTESFVANLIPTVAGALLFNILRREKLKDRWRSFLISILFNAYGLEEILCWFNFSASRGSYFFGAFCSYFLLATLFDILRNLPTDVAPVIRDGIKDKISNFFKVKPKSDVEES